MGRKSSDGRPFRFYWNKPQATAANVYLLLYPKETLKAALASNTSLYPAILAALDRIRADSLISEGRVYGGGLFKMEPKELANLPAGSLLDVLPHSPRALQLEMFDVSDNA
jgi:adenine-specific DNA-methyltransferase